MIVDKGCWERGCACYDSRDKEPGIEVIQKEQYVDGDVRVWWKGQWIEPKELKHLLEITVSGNIK